MKKTLLLLKTGMISLSTPRNERHELFIAKFKQIYFRGRVNSPKDIKLFLEELNFINSPRYLSSSSNYKTSSILSNLSSDFIEWFRGFIDAEGCFLIVKLVTVSPLDL